MSILASSEGSIDHESATLPIDLPYLNSFIF
jgi:hypothetical protein